MQQRSSKLLYDYWNVMRKDRIAPERFEIEPAKIASLLPETFIAECGTSGRYRIRLAGTRICSQMGRELRDSDLLEGWSAEDREALESLLHNVEESAAVASVRFSACGDDGRSAWFEMTLLPLLHGGERVNRILGCLTAIDPPFWLGTTPLGERKVIDFELTWPKGAPSFIRRPARPVQGASEGLRVAPAAADAGGESRLKDDPRRRFRVYEGGLSGNS